MTESSASDAWNALLRLLAVRDRSEHEVSERLQRKGFTPEVIAAVVARANAAGYLDDARFARQRATQLSAGGRARGPRLRQELRRHGLTEGVAEEAAREAEENHAPADVLRELIARRFAGFEFHRASAKEQARVIRFFQRRGFPLGLILTILKEEER